MNFKLLCEDCKKNCEFVECDIMIDNNDIVTYKCENGHENNVLLTIDNFQLLYDMGIMALCNGYYKEAVSDFASALERFYEYFINIILLNNYDNINSIEVLDYNWKHLKKQSERQFGAFVMLYTITFNKKIIINNENIKFRNDVIHQGYIPNKEETKKYAKYIYDFITSILNDLYLHYLNDKNENVEISKLETLNSLSKQIGYKVVKVIGKKTEKELEEKPIQYGKWKSFIDFNELFLREDDSSFEEFNCIYSYIEKNGFPTYSI